ncbi:MAG: hypothetical protein GY711_00375 [bacterium]|nr:hypothetical protein [bacterium]
MAAALSAIHGGDVAFEVCALMTDERMLRAYFDDEAEAEAAAAVAEFDREHEPVGIYVIANLIDQQVAGGRLGGGFVQAARAKDDDIDGIRYLFLDLDAVKRADGGTRPKGSCATDEERQAVSARAKKIIEHLRERGFGDPALIVDSGNGIQLYYCVELAGQEGARLVRGALEAIKGKFCDTTELRERKRAGNEARIGVEVDLAVSNSATLMRLPGTVNRKLADEGREQRLAAVLKANDAAGPVDEDILSGLIAEHERAESKEASTGSRKAAPESRPFDLEYVGAALRHLVQAQPDIVDDRDEWVRVAHALHHAFPPEHEHHEQAFALWVELSERSDKFEGDLDCRRTWNSVRPAGSGQPITPATFIKMAKEDGWAPAKKTKTRQTDTGNTQRLVDLHRERLLFVPECKSFAAWTGTRWDIDRSGGRVLGMTERVCEELHREASRLTFESEERKKAYSWAMKSESKTAREAMVKLAKGHCKLHTRRSAFDSRPYLLGFENGVLDLETGELRPHDPRDLLTKGVQYDLDLAARCPRWEQFLKQTIPDPEIRAYLQRVIGLALIGEILEHQAFFLLGDGANGKSTLCRVLMNVLGPYAAPTPPKLLIRSKGDRHPTEFASLEGVRLAVATDEPDGDLDEAKFKALTGGDQVEARGMRENGRALVPQHTFIIPVNTMPTVPGSKDAIWRRISIIPFEVRVPDDKVNPRLSQELRDERAGIMLWAIEGARAYLAGGLREPQALRELVVVRRWAGDPVWSWLRKATRPKEGAFVRSQELYQAYCRNGAQEGAPITQTAFSGRLREYGWRKKNTQGGAVWLERELLDSREGA